MAATFLTSRSPAMAAACPSPSSPAMAATSLSTALAAPLLRRGPGSLRRRRSSHAAARPDPEERYGRGPGQGRHGRHRDYRGQGERWGRGWADASATATTTESPRAPGAYADAEETALKWVRSVRSFLRNQVNPNIEGIFPSRFNPFHSISNPNNRLCGLDPGYPVEPANQTHP